MQYSVCLGMPSSQKTISIYPIINRGTYNVHPVPGRDELKFDVLYQQYQ